jgi:hypothetical protein
MNDELAQKNDAALENKIDQILQDKFGHILSDITFRIEQAYQLIERTTQGAIAGGKVFAEDLFLPDRAYLTGYTLTNNSPVAGSIAWLDVHVVYNGQDNLITPNANTANKYVWWSATTPAVLQTSNTKPTLALGEVLLFVNNGGTGTVMLSDTNTSLPQMVANLAIDSGSIAASAVTAGKIGTGAINTPGVFTSGVVDSTAIGSSAISAGKIAAGAINTPAIFTAGVVDSNSIGATAVTAGKIASGAISSSANFASGVITSQAIGVNQVTTAAIAPSAITSAEISPGAIDNVNKFTAGVVDANAIKVNAVTPSKLNIMRHLLY